ncbi:hypothetical protein, partial [Geobacter anodireducens]
MGQASTPDRLKFLVDEDLNLQWNKQTWGRDEDIWRNTYKYGYYWPGGTNQKNNIVTLIAEKYLLPHLDGRRDLKIIELAPGGGRFTPELIRLSREMHLVDYNEACISICKERFQYYPNYGGPGFLGHENEVNLGVQGGRQWKRMSVSPVRR